MRARYVLEDRVVLGHVGRFDVRKNHERLLEIFAAFLQLEPRAMLVLIGTGRLEQAVRAQAQELGITDHILFAGLQSNVADWYQMMDHFVMPSRFEGLPVVGIEAQAAGLGCVFSDAVPAEVLLSSHAIQIPLSASNADWAAGLQLCWCRTDPTGGLRYQHRRRPLAAAVPATGRAGVTPRRLREHPQ